MKYTKLGFTGIASLAVLMIGGSSVFGQLYSENYDDLAAAGRWTVNTGPTDSNVDFIFDYDTVGIPSAPNSSGGSTVGMKMQANLFSAAFGGFSVSPNGESFSGDYVLSYDMWQSYQGVEFFPPSGIFPAVGGIRRGAASGTTNLGYGGVLSSGTSANYAGTSDGVFFAATQDGDSGADYRVYSADKPVSYQPNAFIPTDPGFDSRDADATYLAQGGSAFADFDFDNDVDGNDFLLWQRGFGTAPGTANKGDGDANFDDGVDKLDLDFWENWYGRGDEYKTRNAATSTLYTDNFGGENATAAQAADARWSTKLVIDPDNVTDVGVIGYAWREHTITKIGDLITWNVDGIDLIQLDVSNFVTPVGGSNILFGHSDTNSGISADGDAFDLLFTLVDNIEVNTIPSSASAVPEPGTLLIVAMGLVCLAGNRRRSNGC